MPGGVFADITNTANRGTAPSASYRTSVSRPCDVGVATRSSRDGGLRWQAWLYHDGVYYELGTYNTREEGARAYDIMMLWLKFHSVCRRDGTQLNFHIDEYQAEREEVKHNAEDQRGRVDRESAEDIGGAVHSMKGSKRPRGGDEHGRG